MKTVPDITDPKWLEEREKWWNEYHMPSMLKEFKKEDILRYKPIYFGEEYDVNDPRWKSDYYCDGYTHPSEFILLEPVQNEEKWTKYIQYVLDNAGNERNRLGRAEGFLKKRHNYEKMFYKTQGWHSLQTEIDWFHFIQGKEYNPGKVTFFGYEFEENPFTPHDLYSIWAARVRGFLRQGGREGMPLETKCTLTSDYVIDSLVYHNQLWEQRSELGNSWEDLIIILKIISLDEHELKKTLSSRFTSYEKFMASNRPAFAKQLVSLIEASDCDGLKLAWDHVKNKSDDPVYTID